MAARISLPLLSLALLASACSGGGGERGPVEVPDVPAPGEAEPRGFYSINRDPTGSSVSLLELNVGLPSAPLIGSGDADMPLSLDLAAPNAALADEELVLIDRERSVLTWVNVETGAVRARQKLETLYASRPNDYVPLSQSKAYVSRSETSPFLYATGSDRGGDVLIVDPSTPRALGRIDLAAALGLEDTRHVPHPERALAIGARVLLLVNLDAAGSAFPDSRLVLIDAASDTIAQVMVLDGMKGCVNLALSPRGDELAVACGGAYGSIPERGFSGSGIVLVALGDELVEKQRFDFSELGDEATSQLAYASEDSLLFTTLGRYSFDDGELVAPDTLRRLDLERAAIDDEPLVSTRASAASLGDVRCAPRAGLCLLADAETDGGVLHRFQVASDGTVSALGPVAADPELGLPPRYIGVY